MSLSDKDRALVQCWAPWALSSGALADECDLDALLNAARAEGSASRQQASPSREEIVHLLEEAERDFGFSMELTRLVDGEHTYTLTFPPAVGEPLSTWDNTEEVYERVAQVKARFRADRLLAALSPSFPGAGMGECKTGGGL